MCNLNNHLFFSSANCLFAIPANQEFVFMCTENIEQRDILAYMTRELIKSCTERSGKSNNYEPSTFNCIDTNSGN